MNVLFPIAEAAPLYKIGGLGDVGGALPQALSLLGTDVRLALPRHPEIILNPSNTIEESMFNIIYNHKSLKVTVYSTFLPGTAIPVYLFDEPMYLSQHTDASDNHADKFAVFSLAVSTWVVEHTPYWQPQIIHCHDWHTTLIPVILKHKFKTHAYKTIVTIHNFAYQGVTKTPVLQHLDIDPRHCQILSWDLGDGDLNILLEGLLHCDFITTVSPTYAQEILGDEYGEKINHIIESRASKLRGILNGIDTIAYDPNRSEFINHKYSHDNWAQGKAANRMDLRLKLNLTHDTDRTLISFIGRVDPYQKGIGLIIQALNMKLLPLENTQFVFLGTGDPQLESELHKAGDSNPHVKIITRFDEPLAHQIYAASHLTLIPSRFEPCGLVQLIAMRYGTLPVARKTGGLADTVIPSNNGFLFTEHTTEAMMKSLTEATETVNNMATYPQMVKNAMTADYSWHTSAQKYDMLYQELVIGKKDF
jgi:starch synthase